MTTLPLLLSCLWIVAANVAGMVPSRRGHWPAATVLIVTGIPLLGLVTWNYGPVAGLLALAAGASILRWPIRLGLDRARRRVGGRVGPPAGGENADRQTQPAE